MLWRYNVPSGWKVMGQRWHHSWYKHTVQTRSLQTSDAKHNVVQCKYLPLSHPQCGSEFASTGFQNIQQHHPWCPAGTAAHPEMSLQELCVGRLKAAPSHCYIETGWRYPWEHRRCKNLPYICALRFVGNCGEKCQGAKEPVERCSGSNCSALVRCWDLYWVLSKLYFVE